MQRRSGAARLEFPLNESSDAPSLCRHGDALAEAGRVEEAVAHYHRAIALDPNCVDAHNNLGGALAALGRLAAAEESYRRAIAIDANTVVAHYNLGNLQRGLGRLEDAERSYREAIARQPGFRIARFTLANLLKQRGRLEEADFEFCRLLELQPDYVEALNNRGTVLCELGRLDEAANSYRAALALRPGHARAHNNLGNLLRELGHHEEAERCYRLALECDPALAEVHGHHGNSLLDLARLEEAEASHRRAVALDPGNVLARSNLLLFQNYVPGRQPAELLAEHLEFGRQFATGTTPVRHDNLPGLGRKLRVGYVSGDLREHSVAYFIEPVLACHNRSGFEIFCYYSCARGDAVTRRLRQHVDHWREVHALDDGALAGLVRADAIDILVDLSGHTANNRLTAFARKPAPVQVSWLGYPAGTGLAAIDYRLTDAVVDPAGESEAWYVERLVRLPNAMWCFRPDSSMPEVSPSAGPSRRAPTFGSFNYFAKLNSEVTALWARLLCSMPGARLLVTRVPGEETSANLRRRFERAGVARDRLEIHGILPRVKYFELLARTDIALDPFPYAGTTTTCEVLWMGVPVVTLAGQTGAARSGASLLKAVGLEALIARSPADYLDIAESLAGDPVRLAVMRNALRARMAGSPLTDGPRFTADLEAAYRDMWSRWPLTGS